MKSFTIELPDDVHLDQMEIKMVLASKFYERGLLTLGQGARLAGKTKREFIESLGSYGVSVFNYSEVELDDELKNG